MPLKCKEKKKEYLRDYYSKNKKKWVESEIKKREDPEFLGKQAKNNKSWRERNSEKIQDYCLIKKYGITLSEFNKMLESQDNKCKICSSSAWGGRHNKPNTDHCHSTGVVRGLLCNRCNTGIGLFQDDSLLLGKCIEYLKQYEKNSDI